LERSLFRGIAKSALLGLGKTTSSAGWESLMVNWIFLRLFLTFAPYHHQFFVSGFRPFVE